MSNRKPEQILGDRVRRKINDSNFLLKRIENIVGDGMPDLVCQSRPLPRKSGGHTTFIELKVAPAWPARPTTQLLSEANGLRLEQKNWLLDWTTMGGRSLVLIGVKDRSDLHMAIPGRHHDRINGSTVAELMELDGAMMGIGETFWMDLRGML